MRKKRDVKISSTISLIIFFFIFSFSFLFSQWQADYRLTYAAGDSKTAPGYNWNVGTNGDTIHVVWFDDRDGNHEIYYKRSIDRGVNWGSDTRLTYDSDISDRPGIAVFGSFVHILWYDNRNGDFEIYYLRSTDGGTTWETERRLTFVTSNSMYSSIAVFSSLVHIVWTDYRDGNPEVYYKRSPDGGVTWETDTRLSVASGNSFRPSVAVQDSNVHVTWFDTRDGDYEIYYNRSSDGGVTWQNDTRLTYVPASSWYSSVGASGNYVHVVWYDARNGNWKIFYKRSTDKGVTWETDVQLTSNAAGSYQPSIAVSDSNVHVAFHDHRDGNYEIYYKRSTDNGTTWEPETRLTNNSSYSYMANVAVSDSQVNVVWYDARDGNEEIYFKRNPTANPGVNENLPGDISTSNPSLKVSPNPMYERATINYIIPEQKTFSLGIYNCSGQLLRKIFEGKQSPGNFTFIWDGTDNHGNVVSSGIYFCTLKSKKYCITKKIPLIR